MGLLALCLGCSRADPAETSKVASRAARSSHSVLARRPVLEPVAAFSEISGRALLQQIESSGQRGVLLGVWALWCEPCREELPMLARLGPLLAEQGVPIWLVSVDDPSAFVVANALLDSLHVQLRRFGVAPPLDVFRAELDPRWPGMIPVAFLFDAAGKVRHVWVGPVPERELLLVVADFLAGKAPNDAADAAPSENVSRSLRTRPP